MHVYFSADFRMYNKSNVMVLGVRACVYAFYFYASSLG